MHDKDIKTMDVIPNLIPLSRINPGTRRRRAQTEKVALFSIPSALCNSSCRWDQAH
jgi:hypothetical protein